MVTRSTTVTPAGGPRPRPFILAGVVTLMAALALGAAIVTLGGDSSSGNATRSEPPVAPATVQGATAAQPITVFLVASTEEAADLQRRLAALTPGGLSGDTQVLAAGTGAEIANARVAVRTLALELGDGRVRVADLRAAGAAPAFDSAPPCDATPAGVTSVAAC